MTRKTTAYGRKLARQDEYQRRRHEDVSPVIKAVVKRQVQADISSLRADSGLHAFAGGNVKNIVESAARLVYIASYAAGKAGLGESPEARILAGTADGMGTKDVRAALGMP